jgi:hypothetical protein
LRDLQEHLLAIEFRKTLHVMQFHATLSLACLGLMSHPAFEMIPSIDPDNTFQVETRLAEDSGLALRAADTYEPGRGKCKAK